MNSARIIRVGAKGTILIPPKKFDLLMDAAVQFLPGDATVINFRNSSSSIFLQG